MSDQGDTISVDSEDIRAAAAIEKEDEEENEYEEDDEVIIREDEEEGIRDSDSEREISGDRSGETPVDESEEQMEDETSSSIPLHVEDVEADNAEAIEKEAEGYEGSSPSFIAPLSKSGENPEEEEDGGLVEKGEGDEESSPSSNDPLSNSAKKHEEEEEEKEEKDANKTAGLLETPRGDSRASANASLTPSKCHKHVLVEQHDPPMDSVEQKSHGSCENSSVSDSIDQSANKSVEGDVDRPIIALSTEYSEAPEDSVDKSQHNSPMEEKTVSETNIVNDIEKGQDEKIEERPSFSGSSSQADAPIVTQIEIQKEISDVPSNDDNDDDIIVLDYAQPASSTPIPHSTGNTREQVLMKPQYTIRTEQIQRNLNGSQQHRPHQQQPQQSYLLQQGRGGFQQLGVPLTTDATGIRRMKISGGIGSGGTVVMSNPTAANTASAFSSSRNPTSPVIHPSSIPPSQSLNQRMQQVQQMQQQLHYSRRKRVAQDDMEHKEEEEFCFGNHKKLGLDVHYPEDGPELWVTGMGEKVIRMDKMEYATRVPSRERMICLDLRRYEGSEDPKDITRTERLISWRARGLEYDIAAATAKGLISTSHPSTCPSSSPTSTTVHTAPRMKSPRPMNHIQSKSAAEMRPKQHNLRDAQGSSSQVRLIPPSISQPIKKDEDSNREIIKQKIESARRSYAAAREQSQSIIRAGTTFTIPQPDGTVMEFMLDYVPADEARRPDYIQLPREVAAAVPPPLPAANNTVKQRHSTSSTATVAAPSVPPPGPPVDDLSTRYAEYLAKRNKH